MEPYLHSIKQTSQVIVGNKTVEVQFYIDPNSDEQDEIIYPIVVNTEDSEITEYLALNGSGEFKGSLEDLNRLLENTK